MPTNPRENYRDRVGRALASGKKFVVEGLIKRMDEPPASVAGRAQKDDTYRAFWTPGPGWEDPTQHEAKSLAMYAQGAKHADVLKAQYPDRVTLIPFGDRADDLEAQAKFCDEMTARHMEELAGQVVALRDQMNEEGPLP